jgi:sec-independent protein translocase protein TatC
MSFLNRHDRHPDPDEIRMTLGEHLEELRSRIVRALVAMLIGALVCWGFIGYIEGLLTRPMFKVLAEHDLPTEMFQMAPQELFLMDLKVAMISGFILTAPYALAQIWGFVAAGLYHHERRWVRRFVPISIALFFIGALFMLLVVAPAMLDFFVGYRPSYPEIFSSRAPIPGVAAQTQPAWPTTQPWPTFDDDPEKPPQAIPWINLRAHEIRLRLGEQTYTLDSLRKPQAGNRVVSNIRVTDYMMFVLEMMAAFGIGFQMPVVVALISTLGIATAKEMGSFRRHVYFAIAIASAVITPSADWVSMSALMVPMVALFEVGLLAARVIERDHADKATPS